MSGPTAGMTTGALVRSAIEAALAVAESTDRDIAVLDAGCGRVSALVPFRGRIARFVGADVHPPAPGSLPHLDAFVAADLCTDASAFEPASFDLELSSFTVEHFADPPAAIANLRRWLRPQGRLILVTVNRRHPFVAAYLRLPVALRARLQPLVKATAADAHPLVGACNTPTALREALADAGFTDVRLSTVGHLASAWGRRRWTALLGGLGDRMTARRPSRRSTIVVVATAP